jgi:hypothetical protein
LEEVLWQISAAQKREVALKRDRRFKAALKEKR